VSEPISVILAGFGQWAQNRTIIPLIEQYPQLMRIISVTSLSDETEEFENIVKPMLQSKGLDVPEFVTSYENVIEKYSNSRTPVVVIINTPNKFHFQQAKIALEAGFHVYSERPVVCPEDDLYSLIELATQKKKLLFTGVQRRLEDTYSYLHQAVAKHFEFGKLSSIRCFLSTGHRLKGWRRYSTLAGGGIVIDSGYHLLDTAVWIIESTGIDIPDKIPGSVYLIAENPLSEKSEPVEVETTAFGYIIPSRDIFLSFDFTYHAPINSIYERMEIRDNAGTLLTLTRDQGFKTPLPAKITHQRPDGSFVGATTLTNQKIMVENIRFTGKANNTGPLQMFFESINTGETDSVNTHVCHVRQSIGTWKLIREIYRHSKEKNNAGGSIGK